MPYDIDHFVSSLGREPRLMARIREIVPSQQEIRPHKLENSVTCHYKVIKDFDDKPLVHLSTFGSDQRESHPKSSQSLQLTLENAAELMNVFAEAFGLTWRPQRNRDEQSEVEPTFKDATDELAAQLFVPKAWLQECIDLLRDRPQLIFYGPPGTGKTYLAKALAEHLSGQENVKIVQFHPAYSYEDFFEGFRPVQSTDGRLAYHLQQGPLRLLADEARKNPDVVFTLIIDEINRGNLAKIFGELYYLLEYRDESIDLLYSDGKESFALPKNIAIIGTMNTADRSIALVDSAMRRRFAFMSLHPSDEPTRSILRNWLEANGHNTTIADIVDILNATIEDEDFKIGPSYFMRPAAITRHGMDLTWRTSIIPLLQEYHFGDANIDVEQRYSLESIAERAEAGIDGGV
ncbi:McrB family protein [Nocardia abscessus]|uniref:McrB family protein n=1 Tax=Nocardia abscessus TaxID=120957 RepID=UPI002456D076|nr:AAA family ATPase [Nocardia abscessus]